MKPVFSTQTAQKDFDVKSVSLFQLGSVQQRFNTAAPRLLSLQRPAFKVGPSLVSGRMTGKLYLDKWLTMLQLLTQILFIPVFVYFPSGSLEFCCLLDWGGLCDQIPIKTVGAKSLMCYYNMQLEKFSTFCVCLYLERTLRSSVSEFQRILNLCWFSFVSLLLETILHWNSYTWLPHWRLKFLTRGWVMVCSHMVKVNTLGIVRHTVFAPTTNFKAKALRQYINKRTHLCSNKTLWTQK